MHFRWNFQFFEQMQKCVSIAPARVDWGSGPYFSGLVLPFLLSFVCIDFGYLLDSLCAQKSQVGGGAGTPLNELN